MLELRKKSKNDGLRLVFANSLEFDPFKLLKILNEMERVKSAYILNLGSGGKSAILKDKN